MADQKFKITITADNAEAVSKIKELAKSLDGVKTSSGNVGKAQESMATSVFKGVAAWDMLKKGVSMATDFIWSSVKAAAEAERQMAVVKTNVENAGLSYASISPKLKSYSESMIKMGFDNEDTAVSVSRMITVTRDYDKALTMTHLAMDLARNKNIDLATATTLVTQVANGNNKVLKQYSIELSDSASAADNLTTLQGKLKNSTEAYANTGAGKLEIMNVQWEDMKKQVGEALSPAVSDLFTVFEDNLPAITTLVGTLASALGTMAKVAISIAGPLNEAFAWIGQFGAKQVEKFKLSYNINVNGMDPKKAQEQFSENMKYIDKSYMETELKLLGYEQSSVASHKSVGNAALAAGAGLIAIASGFTGIGLAAKVTGPSVDDIKSKIKDFGAQTAEVNHKISLSVDEYVRKQKDALDALSTKIADINKQITEENDNYINSQAQTLEELKKNIGESVVAHEDKRKSLEDELAKETAKGAEASQERIAQLQADIATEIKFLTDNQAIVAKYQIDMDSMRKLAHLDEIQKMILAYEEKKALEDAQHTERLLKLQENLQKEKDTYAANMLALKKETMRSLGEIKYQYDLKFTEINAIIGRSISLRNQLNANYNQNPIPVLPPAPVYGPPAPPELKVGGLAEGGIVNSPTLSWVGESGPEAVIPLNKMGGLGNITININNPNVRNRGDIDAIAKAVEKALYRPIQMGNNIKY